MFFGNVIVDLFVLFVFSCSDAQDRQDRANKTLVNVKAGIEHLADKLQHLKAVRIKEKIFCIQQHFSIRFESYM